MLSEKPWMEGWLDDEGWIGHFGDKVRIEVETGDIGCVKHADVWVYGR